MVLRVMLEMAKAYLTFILLGGFIFRRRRNSDPLDTEREMFN
jgi:hypothetical protein